MSELQVIIILTVYVLRVLSQVCLWKKKEKEYGAFILDVSESPFA
jgi:hypothetical protein